MAAPADNVLQIVQTYQPSALGRLQNSNAFIANANTRFKDFEKEAANLGDTVTFDKPPRMYANDTLNVSSFDAIEQRVQSLTVDQEANVNYAMDSKQLVFYFSNNDRQKDFEESAMAELGSKIEAQFATNILSSAYRYYGNGVTPINSFEQLAMAMAYFRNFGCVKTDFQAYIDDVAEAQIVGSGLNKFVPMRNDDIAMSWEIGRYSNFDFFRSNLLPIHTAGSVGEEGRTLTVVSINAAGTQLTLTDETATDADAIKKGDLLQFQDNVAGESNIRFRTFTGHAVSSNPVQVRATADAETSGSTVVVNIFPALISAAGKNQNISVPVSAGMQLKALPSHRAGMLCSGKPMFLAMPTLPDQVPFPTKSSYDSETGVALRFYYGTIFGQNTQGAIYDCIWGGTYIPEQTMRLVFPL